MADMTWQTSIAEVQTDDVVIRGHRLNDLIGKVSYTDMAFLLVRGDLPAENESKMLEAVMVSLVDHGISPSSIVARSLASCGTPIQASIAGAMLSIADWHGGSGEDLARVLAETVERRESFAEDGAEWPAGLSEGCDHIIAERKARREQIPGYGHPQHVEGDPRATKLLALARELGVDGRHCELLFLLGERLEAATGKEVLRAPNITGALAAILLDLGFPWQSLRGFVIASRSLGLTAHIVEELEQGNRWRHSPAEDVEYTGPKPD
jgi:citrate synthase